LKEMTCQVCGRKFFCHGDEHCAREATECYCKECSIKKFGTKDFTDIGSLEQCYGGITDKEVVQFT
jgi:hypothetical protein